MKVFLLKLWALKMFIAKLFVFFMALSIVAKFMGGSDVNLVKAGVLSLLFSIAIVCFILWVHSWKFKKLSYISDNGEFEVGQILKMEVAERSHVLKPYYVEVIYYDESAKHNGSLKMITSIPMEHTLEMTVGSNWEYHYKRMTIIGNKSEYGHLLYNQDLTCKYKGIHDCCTHKLLTV